MNKVWIYIISKPLSEDQLNILKKMGEDFVQSWTAHEVALSATFKIYKQRLIVISSDERVHSASGCSIDKQVRFIKELEQRFSIELLNRMLVAYEKDGGIEIVRSSEIVSLLREGAINEATFVYDTSVSTSDALEKWRIPLRDSWLKKYLGAIKN